MANFQRSSNAFRCNTKFPLVSTKEIEPIMQIQHSFSCPSGPNDFQGFQRHVLVQILIDFVSNKELEPISLSYNSERGGPGETPFRYKVGDGTYFRDISLPVGFGVHKLYASIAVGFDYVPASLSSLSLANLVTSR